MEPPVSLDTTDYSANLAQVVLLRPTSQIMNVPTVQTCLLGQNITARMHLIHTATTRAKYKNTI